MTKLCILIVSILIISCVERTTESDRRDLPELNVSKQATLETRSREVDNYTDSCLFLTKFDQKGNDCLISLQTNDAITGEQVVDDVANFQLLEEGTSHQLTSNAVKADLGSRIEAGIYSVGDEYSLIKTDSNTKIVLTFKILEIDVNSFIRIEYQVKEYKIL